MAGEMGEHVRRMFQGVVVARARKRMVRRATAALQARMRADESAEASRLAPRAASEADRSLAVGLAVLPPAFGYIATRITDTKWVHAGWMRAGVISVLIASVLQTSF